MRISKNFFKQDAKKLANRILGMYLCRRFDNGSILKKQITEVEIYYDENDLASHASKGRTKRTEAMYMKGGHVYVYFIYGMYWLFNIVTGPKDHPQALLIRGLDDIFGSGLVGKLLKLDKSFYGEDLSNSTRIWIEKSPGIKKVKYKKLKRIGIDYAQKWAEKPWRYRMIERCAKTTLTHQ